MTIKLKFPLRSLCLALVASAGLVGCSATSTETYTNLQTQNNQEKVMAYGRFVPERRDDFAWENDKVAFRVYGPAAPLKGHSSGVDAWLKKVDYSIIDKWYKAHTQGISYHEDHGEGYDPYHTGISRGVGGTAIWLDGKPYTAHSYKSYKVLESGSNNFAVELEYEWYTPLGIVKEMKTISLPLGTHLFEVNSTFTLDGKPASLPIAIGVATHDEKAKVFYNKDTGRISAWEEIDDLGIGTGALLDPKLVESIKHMPTDVKDESHIWMFTKTDDAGKLNYKAGFAWQGAGEITTNKAWQTYLDKLAK
ncbi:DUF4861 family protein [Paraglaciecola sp.]|uniref:DUF4861 family protein n=1 Tax=Paraglaciecola sp. TaxID=1920173 RepID=UPI003EF59EA1